MSSNQRAQVPGYGGYVPGKNSENKFGATFARVSTGSYPTPPSSFLTTNIAASSLVQQQHSQEDKFWGNSGKLSAFQQPGTTLLERNKRTPVEKFVPERVTDLTYEEAVRRKL